MAERKDGQRLPARNDREEQQDYNESATALARHANPVERFAQLPPHTRAFLEELSREDVATILGLIKAGERFAALGWFFKWVILGSATAFVGLYAFGKAVRDTFTFWRG